MRCSGLRENDTRLGDDGPFLLRDVVLVDVNVVSVGVQVMVEDQRSVHEAARIDKAATLAHLHFLDIEYEAPVEDMEGGGTLPTEQQDLIIGDLVSEAHVAGNPARLVDLRGGNLLPDVARNVVNFNSINDSLLIDAPAESEDVVVLEDAEGGSGAGHTHISNELPFVLLRVVHLAVPIDLVAHECANDINEVLNCADRVVGMWVIHVGNWVQDSEEIIVAVAVLQVHTHVLDVATSQINSACFSRN